MKSRSISLLRILLLLTLGGGEARGQWYAIPQLQYTNIKCFLTVGDSTVFVAGDNGFFYRSTDNGTNWTNVMGNGFWADTILCLGKGGGYVFAGANGVSSVYRSSDNGDSWSVANRGLPAIASMNAFTWIDSTLYAATNFGVFSSTDFGGNWKVDTAGLGLNQLYIGQMGGIAGITSVGSNLYVIKSMWGGVYKSAADSILWCPIGLDTVWGCAIASIDTNVFAGTPKGVYLFSGSGSIWLPRSNGLPGYLSLCILTTADTLLFVFTGSRNDGIYMSSDFGLTWTAVDASLFGGKMVHALVTTKSYLLAGTERGAWRLPIDALITSVNDISPVVPARYTLNQNYPNPFNPTTQIQYSVPVRGLVSLKVCNLLGQEVATLFDGVQQAGDHKAMFDGTGLAGGVYFYQIRAGSFIQTKKLVLLK